MARSELPLSKGMEDLLVESVQHEDHYVFGHNSTRDALIRRELAVAEGGGWVRLTYRGAKVAARIQRKREEASAEYRKASEIKRANRVSRLLRLGYESYTVTEHVGERQEDMGLVVDARKELLRSLADGYRVTQIDTNGARIRIQGRNAYIELHAVQTPAIEPKGMYARRTGATGLGWARRVCEDNSASVRDMIARARNRGDAVVVEAGGVIRIDNAGVIDPSFAGAGERCPVWFVPNTPTPEVTRVPMHEGYDTLGKGDEWGEDFYILVNGVEVGGTYFCSADYIKDGERWASWGTAGLSMRHATREDAEAVQVEKWLEADQTPGGVPIGIDAGAGSEFALAANQTSRVGV